MFRLYHHPFLPACQFIRLAFAEYRAPFELVLEPFWERRAEFLALDPAAALPIARENLGPPICGTWPLMEYLEETRGYTMTEHRLMPAGPDQRAEVRRLVGWFLNKFEDEVAGPFITEKMMKVIAPSFFGGGEPDSQALRIARRNIRAHINYIGHLVASRSWIAGEEISFADLAAAAALSSVDYLGEVPWDSDEAVKVWYARVKSRPSFRPLLTDTVQHVRPAPHYADLDF